MEKDFYTRFDNEQYNDIKENYKVIQVPWLDATQVNYKMFNDNFFSAIKLIYGLKRKSQLKKKQIIFAI